MSEIISTTEHKFDLNGIDFFNFVLNVLPRTKATQIIESYDMLVSYGDEEDSNYMRAAELIQELTLDHLKERFLGQLTYGEAPIFEGNNLQDLIEQGAIASLENFGAPTHIIKLDDNLYVVGQVSAETITLRTLSENEGAILVYTPKFFSILKLKE